MNQTFEFVSINCGNDSVTILGNLGILYFSTFFSSCYDYTSNTYFLCAGRFILIIDALTGNIDTNILAIPPQEQFVHIVFNPKDRLIYGIIQNTINLDQKWGRYDPINNSMDTLLSIVPHVGNGIGCKSVFNALTQEYIIQSTYLASVDITNGHGLYNYPIQNQTGEVLDHIAFSCNTQTIYGLSNNPHTEEEYFAGVDTLSAAVTHINTSPLAVSYYKQYLGGSTIDNTTDTYYYPASGGIIYGIDIHSGNIVYSHNYGPGFDFLFLESGSNYHCPVSGMNDVSNENILSPYPNPSNGFFNFDLSALKSNSNDISILDITGKTVMELHEIKNRLTVDLTNYNPGIYIYQIKNKLEVYSGKLLVVSR